jgi:Domain of unknown function (DUF4397)
MKTNINFKIPKPFSLFAIILLAATCFTSCQKGSNNEVAISAFIMAANSAQTSAPQDFYVDNNKVNSSAIAYTQSTSYISISSGGHQEQFKTSSTSTVNTSFNSTFSPGSYNTVFYTDDNTATTYQDDRTSPQPGNARVRFVNLSSALTANVDFTASTGGKIVAGLVYKSASVYNEVSSASTFSLSASGSSSVLLNIPVTLQAGKIYTIFISGATSATITYTVIAES